jgi:hypothetical protein
MTPDLEVGADHFVSNPAGWPSGALVCSYLLSRMAWTGLFPRRSPVSRSHHGAGSDFTVKIPLDLESRRAS